MSLDWKNFPSLSSLRAFDATANSGGFSAAARALNVTHAAVAQQVRRLEAELSIALVRRAGRNVALTDAGQRLAGALRNGFAAIGEGVEDLRRVGRRPSLRVTTTTHIADTLILPHVFEFWERYPDIEVALLPSANYVDIIRDEFDLAIRAGSGKWPGLNAELLANSHMVAVGTPELIGDGTPDLHDLPWIWSKSVDWELGLLKSAGLDSETAQLIDIGSPHLELSAVRQGLGMIIASEIIVRNDLESGLLRQVPIPPLPDVGYYAVTPPGPRRPTVAAFIEWLKSIFII